MPRTTATPRTTVRRCLSFVRSFSGSLGYIYIYRVYVVQSLTLRLPAILLFYSIQITEEEQQEEDDNAEEDEQDDADDEDDADNRKLKAFERKLSGNYVDCSTCDSLSCWEAEEEEGQDQNEQNDMYMDDDELAEYVANFAGCAETGYVTDTGVELRAGFICGNRDGKNGGTGTYGPEIGLFLDEDCLVYYKSMDYYQLAAGGYQSYANQQDAQDANQEDAQDGDRKLEDMTYLTSDQLSTMIEYIVDPYKNGISCEAFPEFDEYKEDGEEEEEEQQEEANYEANEICQQIMEADAVPLATCGYDNQDEQDDAEDQAEEEWEENEYNFMWEYELSEDEVDDISSVCTFYNTYDFEGYKGNVYSGEFHYKDDNSSTFASMGDMSAGAKFGIAVLVLAIVGGIAFVALKKQKAADDYKLEPLHDAKGASA